VTGIEQILRELAPGVLAALLRSSGDLETSEDAVQEALLAAAVNGRPRGCREIPGAGWSGAVHDEAKQAADTDWLQILGLYVLLERISPGPMVTLNRIVAVAMVSGPEAGLAELATAELVAGLAGHHRLHAVRADLLERSGDPLAAGAEYHLAARRTLSIPEQRHLRARADRLAPAADPPTS
jgi:predicted RNA polymerase sigma factor